MFLKGKRLSFKIGLLLAITHLFFFIRYLFTSMNGYAGLDAFVLFIFDIFLTPLCLLLQKLFPDFYFFGHYNYKYVFFGIYGILGTLCWFFIPIGIARIAERFTRPKIKEQFK